MLSNPRKKTMVENIDEETTATCLPATKDEEQDNSLTGLDWLSRLEDPALLHQGVKAIIREEQIPSKVEQETPLKDDQLETVTTTSSSKDSPIESKEHQGESAQSSNILENWSSYVPPFPPPSIIYVDQQQLNRNNNVVYGGFTDAQGNQHQGFDDSVYLSNANDQQAAYQKSHPGKYHSKPFKHALI